MGREVRRVPKNWEHPMVEMDRYRDGRVQKVMDHQPMYDEDFETAMDQWYTGFKAHKPEEHDGTPFWDWEGSPPDPKYYRPKWSDAERTHLMMYEDTSEGTPISPAFETPEELARWLTDNGASSFASMTATYEQWLKVCQGGWAPSMVIERGVMKSGFVRDFFNMAARGRSEPYEFEALSQFNAEVARGLVHTDEYKTRMALEQRRFNMKHYGTETPKPGGLHFKANPSEKP